VAQGGGEEQQAAEEGQEAGQTMSKGPKSWEPEELAALQQVVDQFPLGLFSWKKRLEEFGECWLADHD
jgi:hypothetical protein